VLHQLLDQDLKEPYITVSSLGLPTGSTHAAAATVAKGMTLCSPLSSLIAARLTTKNGLSRCVATKAKICQLLVG
jgi:hypothetical protein